jgi:hypothetical protein
VQQIRTVVRTPVELLRRRWQILSERVLSFVVALLQLAPGPHHLNEDRRLQAIDELLVLEHLGPVLDRVDVPEPLPGRQLPAVLRNDNSMWLILWFRIRPDSMRNPGMEPDPTFKKIFSLSYNIILLFFFRINSGFGSGSQSRIRI